MILIFRLRSLTRGEPLRLMQALQSLATRFKAIARAVLRITIASNTTGAFVIALQTVVSKGIDMHKIEELDNWNSLDTSDPAAMSAVLEAIL